MKAASLQSLFKATLRDWRKEKKLPPMLVQHGGWMMGDMDGLPVGVHLAARFGADEELIALCAEIEAACPWIGQRPSLIA